MQVSLPTPNNNYQGCTVGFRSKDTVWYTTPNSTCKNIEQSATEIICMVVTFANHWLNGEGMPRLHHSYSLVLWNRYVQCSDDIRIMGVSLIVKGAKTVVTVFPTPFPSILAEGNPRHCTNTRVVVYTCTNTHTYHKINIVISTMLLLI